MSDELVEPFLVTYGGRDADRHVVRADLLGQSIVGAAGLYTSVAHYCVFGFVPRGKYKKQLAVYARATQPGSVEQWMFVGPVLAGEYAIHAHLYNKAIGFLFSKVVDTIKGIWTRPSEVKVVVDRLAQTIDEQARINADLQGQLIAGLVRSNDGLTSLHSKLIDTLPELARRTRHHGVNLVQPIGVSCGHIVQFAGSPLASTINEPEAEVIRGEGEMEVDNVADYRVNRIKEINLATGHCIVDVAGIGEVIGTITDPVLQTPDNIYTRSLNHHTGCSVKAKAVRKAGSISKLFISDATL